MRLRLMGTSVPVRPRFEGVMNDAAYLSSLAVYPLERIVQPTLIIHGDSDEVVPFANAEFAASKIPGAHLMTFEHGSHFAPFVRASRNARSNPGISKSPKRLKVRRAGNVSYRWRPRRLLRPQSNPRPQSSSARDFRNTSVIGS